MQKFDEGFFPRASKEVSSLIWSGIEVVITRRTRNAFAVDSGTWVRIPPTPPYENQVLYVVQDFFFLIQEKSCASAQGFFIYLNRAGGISLPLYGRVWPFLGELVR